MTTIDPRVKPQGRGRDGSSQILALAREQWPGRLGSFSRPGRGEPSFAGRRCPADYEKRWGADAAFTAAPHHPNVPRIERLLEKTWPAGFASVANLVDAVWLADAVEPVAGARGSVSGHLCPAQGFDGLGVMATVFDVIGGVEAVLHETGHLRLRCLGTQVETHDGRILANRPEELYVSAIRKDKKRPMSACLHALYSYLMVSEFDVRLAATGRRDAFRYLGWNIPRLEFGLAETRRHAVPARTGPLASWLPQMFDWCSDVIDRGNALLRAERRRLRDPRAFTPHASTAYRPAA